MTSRTYKIAILAGNQSAPNLRNRANGVVEEIKKHPGMTVVETVYHQETPEQAAATVQREQTARPEIEGWAMIGGWALFTPALLTQEASALAGELAQVAVSFKVRAGEGGKLYGSVTAQNVVDEIKRTTGLEVDRHKVELREPIRALGAHKVAVRLSSELVPEVTVNVVREDAGLGEAQAAPVAAAE